MVEYSTVLKNQNWQNYYITSAGRIWGVTDEEKLKGEAQERRNVLGNSFRTVEEACYAKSQIEAWARLKPYAKTRVIFRNGNPVMEVEFYLPAGEPAFKSDILLLSNQYQEDEPEAHIAF